MSESAWPAEFEEILRANLPLLTAGAPLPPDASLADLGLDSMATVALLIELEDAFDAAVPDEKLVGETFATPAGLWEAIGEHRAG